MNNVYEWDGHKRVRLGDYFTYRGKEYIAYWCSCGCRRLSAFEIPSYTDDHFVTFLVRGKANGLPMAEVLRHLVSEEELAKALETPFTLLDSFLAEMAKNNDLSVNLEDKGVSQELLKLANVHAYSVAVLRQPRFAS